MTVNGGGILNVYSAGANVTVAVGSLSGSGTVHGEGGGTHTVKIGGDGTNTLFSGILENGGGAGPLAVTKVGTGTQTLSNAGSTYTGTLTIARRHAER